MISRANQLTGLYMMATLAFSKLSKCNLSSTNLDDNNEDDDKTGDDIKEQDILVIQYTFYICLLLRAVKNLALCFDRGFFLFQVILGVLALKKIRK